MDAEEYKRKLTAILNAGVTGYSLLMGVNQVATYSTLKSDRILIDKIFQAFKGYIADSPCYT